MIETLEEDYSYFDENDRLVTKYKNYKKSYKKGNLENDTNDK